MKNMKFLETSFSGKIKMVESLKSKKCFLIKELEWARDTIQKLFNGTARLDHIMSTKIESNDKKEIGFIDEATAPSTSKTTFVKSS